MPRAMWLPGRDHGLVWSGGVAILDGSVSMDVVERIWLLLEGGADLRAFLEGMSAAIGSGLLGLPGFAIGLVRDDAMNLAVRGDFVASVVGAEEPIRIEGVGVSTWSERQVIGGEEVTVGRVGVEPARGLILIGGVVPAGLVIWHRREHAPAATPVPEPRHTARGGSTGGDGTPAATPAVEVTRDQDRAEDEERGPANRFEALWGETVLNTVEEAAIRPVEEKPRPPQVDRVTLVEAPSAVRVDEAPSRMRSFIDAVPRPPGPPGGPGPAGPERRGDHDGATVARSDLEESGGAPASGGGEIRASLCPEQHPNPPQNLTCRICGRAVGAGVVIIPQPSIGRVHASTGESVDLTGPVIVGRNPRPARFQGTRLPVRLALPFPHISGSHLELRVEGWSLLAVDLESKNGTFLRRGEDPPQRLTANTPVPLYAGDVIDFGDDVLLTFDYLA